MNNKWGTKPANAPENTARIIRANREQYILANDETELQAVVKGALRYTSRDASGFPVIGDWVEYEKSGDMALIKQVFTRATVISRKTVGASSEEQPIAANIDIVGIVMGLDGGRNYNVRALERYLTLAWNSGAVPLIILNKADVCEDIDAVRIEAESAAPGVEILVTSAVNGKGMEQLTEAITPGKTILFIGPSGVGKSAISNALVPEAAARTNETRKGDKRGRHTTTNSMLYLLPHGGLLIDSPGLKEIQLWGDTDGVDAVFEEISVFAKECRFNDCTHTGEPGCAVQEALYNGELDEARYVSYLDLKKELEYLAFKTGERAKQQEHLHNKKFGKMVREIKKHHHKYRK